MAVAGDEATQIRIDPERDRVRVRCEGPLANDAAVRLAEDCDGLIERGFDHVILDMTGATAISPAAVSAIAALNRRARAHGCRLSVVPGAGDAAATMRRAGLLGQLRLEGAAETFLDWSR